MCRYLAITIYTFVRKTIYLSGLIQTPSGTKETHETFLDTQCIRINSMIPFWKIQDIVPEFIFYKLDTILFQFDHHI